MKNLFQRILLIVEEEEEKEEKRRRGKNVYNGKEGGKKRSRGSAGMEEKHRSVPVLYNP